MSEEKCCKNENAPCPEGDQKQECNEQQGCCQTTPKQCTGNSETCQKDPCCQKQQDHQG